MKLRIIASAILGFLLVTTAFAGIEDWKGSFTIQTPDGSKTTVIHTPTYVNFTFIRAGQCINLSKGSNMNGIIPKQDVKLCVASNIDDFTYEVQSLGMILDKTITPGPTYTP